MREAFTIELPKIPLAAVAKFAGEHDIRYYLNGVCIEVTKDEARMIATDGHTLGLYRIKEGVPVKATQKVILPIERVLKVEKPTKAKMIRGKVPTITLSVEAAAGKPFATLIDGETSVRFPLIDGDFPEYRQVFPLGKPNGEAAHFQTRYLTRLEETGKLLDGKSKYGCCYSLSFNGAGPTLAKFRDEDFIAVLMPLRDYSDGYKVTPEWIGAKPKEPKSVKKSAEAVPA